MFPSSEMTLLSILYVDRPLSKVFLVNTWYVLYLLANRRMELHRNLCVVFYKVLEEILKLILHISLKSFIVTSGCWSELENVFEASTSDLPESNWLSRTKTFEALTSGSDVVTYVEAIFWLIWSKSNNYSEFSSSWWCRSRLVTALTKFIEPTTSWSILLINCNQNTFGLKLCGDNNIMWGNAYN